MQNPFARAISDSSVPRKSVLYKSFLKTYFMQIGLCHACSYLYVLLLNLDAYRVRLKHNYPQPFHKSHSPTLFAADSSNLEYDIITPFTRFRCARLKCGLNACFQRKLCVCDPNTLSVETNE